jgi:phage major head subunit gpT-like protein
MAITDYYCRGLINKIITTTPMSDGLNGLAVSISSMLPAGSSERLDFLGTIGPMREWFGARQPMQPIEYNYTVKNRKFEVTADLLLDWIKNDKTGNVMMTFSQLGQRMKQWRGKLIADLINNGATGGSYLAYDGLSYFNTGHVYGVGQSIAINNVVPYTTGAGPSVMTPYEAAKAIVKGIQALLSFLDDRGEPMNEDITAIAVVVPVVANSIQAASFYQAISNPKLDTGSGSVDNPVFGLKQQISNLVLLPSARITGTAVYLVNITPNAMPFVFQENLGERLVTVKGAGSDYEHDADAWQYGLKTVGNAGYGRLSDAVQLLIS